MLRRLYWLFPSCPPAERAVRELKQLGVSRKRIHTLGPAGLDLGNLPPATLRQRSDLGAKIEHLIWNLNLSLFFLALGVALIALWQGSWSWAVGCGLFMLGSVFAGNYFASRIPKTHLDQQADALRHNEILLMVDVPVWRIAEVENAIKRHHPELYGGGVGWTTVLFRGI